ELGISAPATVAEQNTCAWISAGCPRFNDENAAVSVVNDADCRAPPGPGRDASLARLGYPGRTGLLNPPRAVSSMSRRAGYARGGSRMVREAAGRPSMDCDRDERIHALHHLPGDEGNLDQCGPSSHSAPVVPARTRAHAFTSYCIRSPMAGGLQEMMRL